MNRCMGVLCIRFQLNISRSRQMRRIFVFIQFPVEIEWKTKIFYAGLWSKVDRNICLLA